VWEVVNGVMYVLSTGCQWRYIPKDLPPRSTVHDYLTCGNDDGTIERIHHALYVQCREALGREASPTACVIDSQSVKSAEKGGPALIRPGMMRARRSKACPCEGGGQEATYPGRHGRFAAARRGASRGHPEPALGLDPRDRDGGVLLLSTLFGMYPFLVELFADAGYQGPQFATTVAQVLPDRSIEIVKRSDHANGFVVLPMRWVVERTLAWLNRCHRLAKDFENLSRNALAFPPARINPPDAAKALQSNNELPGLSVQSATDPHLARCSARVSPERDLFALRTAGQTWPPLALRGLMSFAGRAESNETATAANSGNVRYGSDAYRSFR